jgi:hypothetical protein
MGFVQVSSTIERKSVSRIIILASGSLLVLLCLSEQTSLTARASSGCATSGCEQVQQTAHLFDYLVGDGEHGSRDIDPERLGCLEVDHELEFCRLLYERYVILLTG